MVTRGDEPELVVVGIDAAITESANKIAKLSFRNKKRPNMM